MIQIRAFEEKDWAGIWRIIEPVFRAGETYPCPTDITEAEARKAWIDKPAETFVAVDGKGEIVGTYYIKPNQPGLGSHVCNCGYIVSEDSRKTGIGAELCEHSQHEAVSRGFRAMQYNLVVSTNKSAFRLWKRHGLEVVGILPKSFRHARLGYVDAYVMYKELVT